MKSGFKIAVSGKGGVGKTTVCAIWAHLFARDGLDVLAIDADSDPNLASALGISAENAPEPLIKMKELIHERTGAKPGVVGQYFKLNPNVSDLPEKYSYKIDGVKLLSLGSVENAGSGCACPEGAFLKALLSYTILHREELILIDMAAGLEFMGRACVQGVDALVVVVEPGKRSIETACSIAKMAQQLGISQVGAFINKVTDPQQVNIIKSQLNNMRILGSFEYNNNIQVADLQRQSVFDSCDGLVEELAEAKKMFTEQLSNT